MKRLALGVICVACVFAVAQSIMLGDPVRIEVSKLLESRSSAAGPVADLDGLKALHHALAGGRPNAWRMPPEMLRSTQEAVEPLRDLAKELAESQSSGARYYGAVLNSYLKQTAGTRSLLLMLAHDDRSDTAGTAMDALFGFKIETPELRRELVAAMQENNGPREHSTLYSLAVTNVGRWGVVEALPVLLRRLESFSDGTIEVDRNVVRQIKELGTSAASALPLLRLLAEKRRSAGDADFREIEDLDHAVLVVSGEYKALQVRDNLPQTAPTPSAVQRTVPEVTPEAESVAPARSETPALLASYGIIVVLIVAIGGLLWWLLKRRS